MARIFFVFLSIIMVSCFSVDSRNQENDNNKNATEHIITEDYEMHIPEQQNAVLILFPCMPCNAENTKAEFNITEIAEQNNITLFLMNFNQRLWLTKKEKQDLEHIIINATQENNVPIDNAFIGGFSSGGNVSMLLTDYLKSSGSKLQPKGVFIADSPIDLFALHKNAVQTIERNFSEPAVAEANWILDMSKRDFGEGDSSLVHYEQRSPYSSRTKSNQNISHLEGVKVRLYTEPDTAWWMENKQARYENMNAYYIEQLAQDLEGLNGKETVELIKTENRGFRSNGMRHPHSWSIIDEKELVEWMLKK